MGNMFISYFDESGDDGFPKYSSELFILTSVYMPYVFWQENYKAIYEFRKFFKTTYGMPIKQEFHTKEFITGKAPYFGTYSLDKRKEVLTHYCKLIATLKLKIINVAIDKTKIQRPEYDVLKNALTYNTQRIENDLDKRFPGSKFLMITDEGRVGKMRDITRSMQKINYIPSQYNPNSYRQEIKTMIEDPLPKDSNSSPFIQIADTVAFIVSLYVKENLCLPKIDWSNRVRNVINTGDEIEMLNYLKKNLNLKASGSNEFGIVYYPK